MTPFVIRAANNDDAANANSLIMARARRDDIGFITIYNHLIDDDSILQAFICVTELLVNGMQLRGDGAEERIALLQGDTARLRQATAEESGQ